MAGIRSAPPLKGPASVSTGRGNLLAGAAHYALKPMRIPTISAPKIPAPKAPAIPKGPAVTTPKFASLGGLGPSSMGAAGPIASNRPHMSKQITPRITPMRRDLIPASRPIGMTSQDEGSGGLQ